MAPKPEKGNSRQFVCGHCEIGYGRCGLTERVDVGPEKLGGLAEELEDGDAAGSLGIGEQLDKEGCRSR